MFAVRTRSMQYGRSVAALAVVALLALVLPSQVYAGHKKKGASAQQEVPLIKELDYSRIVWPNPPAITRIQYTTFYAAEKPPTQPASKKSSWMDRLSGVATGENSKNSTKPLFQLAQPYGLAVDSKGNLYVADTKVGAVFVFNTETKDATLIKNGQQAHFGLITGLAIDDDDRLFVSDSALHHVLVFDPNHRVIATIAEGMGNPGGLAIDTENRFLYVADAALDQVLVYDADSFKLLRKMGTAGKKHTLTTPGDFAVPTNVAVDKDGNLYVSDTFNDRVEVFDADGTYVRLFGKPGDGPGHFARPKGLAVDSDGHIWVADSMQDRVQVFDQRGRLLIWFGSHGLLPGQFSNVAGIAIDKNNRVFTSEQFIGRVQQFRYVADAEARAELAQRQQPEKDKSAAAASASKAGAQATSSTP